MHRLSSALSGEAHFHDPDAPLESTYWRARQTLSGRGLTAPAQSSVDAATFVHMIGQHHEHVSHTSAAAHDPAAVGCPSAAQRCTAASSPAQGTNARNFDQRSRSTAATSAVAHGEDPSDAAGGCASASAPQPETPRAAGTCGPHLASGAALDPPIDADLLHIFRNNRDLDMRAGCTSDAGGNTARRAQAGGPSGPVEAVDGCDSRRCHGSGAGPETQHCNRRRTHVMSADAFSNGAEPRGAEPRATPSRARATVHVATIGHHAPRSGSSGGR